MPFRKTEEPTLSCKNSVKMSMHWESSVEEDWGLRLFWWSDCKFLKGLSIFIDVACFTAISNRQIFWLEKESSNIRSILLTSSSAHAIWKEESTFLNKSRKSSADLWDLAVERPTISPLLEERINYRVGSIPWYFCWTESFPGCTSAQRTFKMQTNRFWCSKTKCRLSCWQVFLLFLVRFSVIWRNWNLLQHLNTERYKPC